MIPTVPCHCLDAEGTSDAYCDACRGAGAVEVRCSLCRAPGEITDVAGRDVLCVECLIAWEAKAEPLSELLEGHRCGSPVRGMPEARSVDVCSDDYYALRDRGWIVVAPADVTDPRRIMLPFGETVSAVPRMVGAGRAVA